MDRLTAGLMIALVAFVLNGGLVKDVFAEDTSRLALSYGHTVPSLPVPPTSAGSRSARVMSMLITLGALRAAPAALEPRSR